MGWNPNRCGMLIIAYLRGTKGGVVAIAIAIIIKMSTIILISMQTTTTT